MLNIERFRRLGRTYICRPTRFTPEDIDVPLALNARRT